MIIDYEDKYQKDVENLLEELQQYIASIDIEGYNICKPGFKEKYFKETMQEVKENNGHIFLYQDENKIVGLVIGLINNEETDDVGFKVPKRGRVTELIVTSKCRSKGVGRKLLERMEQYLKDNGCKDILIGVFAYNDLGLKFYFKNGYHLRMTDAIKTNI